VEMMPEKYVGVLVSIDGENSCIRCSRALFFSRWDLEVGWVHHEVSKVKTFIGNTKYS
jgi:hypothetical protein